MLKELLSAIKLAATEKIQMISQRGGCAAGLVFVKAVFSSCYLGTFCILSAPCTCQYCDLPAMISMGTDNAEQCCNQPASCSSRLQGECVDSCSISERKATSAGVCL